MLRIGRRVFRLTVIDADLVALQATMTTQWTGQADKLLRSLSAKWILDPRTAELTMCILRIEDLENLTSFKQIINLILRPIMKKSFKVFINTREDDGPWIFWEIDLFEGVPAPWLK